MTITPDQAKTLLDTATDGIWTTDRDDPDEMFRILSIRKKGDLITGTPIADEIDSDGDAAMILSAPDLARTVIDQAEQIDALSTALRFLSETYNTDIARLAAELPDNEMVYDLETGHPDGEATISRVVGILHQAQKADQ